MGESGPTGLLDAAVVALAAAVFVVLLYVVLVLLGVIRAGLEFQP